MKRWAKFFGILGLVILLFGLIGGFAVEFEMSLMMIPLLHLIAGILLLGFWFFTFGFSNLAVAGDIVRGRTAKYGSNFALYAVVFLGIIVVVNWLSARHDKKWDLTQEGVYSLADQSEKVVEGLKQPLKLIAIRTAEAPDREAVKDLLDRYKDVNPSKITTEILNPESKPHLLEKYQIKAGNMLYLAYGEGDKISESRINELTEDGITNAIVKLTRGAARRIYYVSGHDEPDVSNGKGGGFLQFAEAVNDEHLELAPIVLSKSNEVPKDAAAVILASPKKALLPEEKKMLIDYAKDGGRLLLLTDPRTTEDVASIASEFGIKIGNDVIVDQVVRLFAGPALGVEPVISSYGEHPITKNFSENHISIFKLASSVADEPAKRINDATYTKLALTSPNSWAETDLASIFDSEQPSVSKGPEDQQGPVGVGLAYEKKLAPPGNDKEADTSFEKATRIVVFGNSTWLMNGNIGVYANRDLILNSLNWLISEEGGISIRPKELKKSTEPIDQTSFIFVLLTSFLVPEVILIAGLFVWWRRKSLSIQ